MDQNKKAPQGMSGSSSLKALQGNKRNKNKYTKYQREVQNVRTFLTKRIATQTMTSVSLGIYRPNLCRIKRELQDLGVLVEVRKGICQETGYRASYLTCNPQLIQEMKKGGSSESKN